MCELEESSHTKTCHDGVAMTVLTDEEILTEITGVLTITCV
jgi:hypothetical protein